MLVAAKRREAELRKAAADAEEAAERREDLVAALAACQDVVARLAKADQLVAELGALLRGLRSDNDVLTGAARHHGPRASGAVLSGLRPDPDYHLAAGLLLAGAITTWPGGWPPPSTLSDALGARVTKKLQRLQEALDDAPVEAAAADKDPLGNAAILKHVKGAVRAPTPGRSNNSGSILSTMRAAEHAVSPAAPAPTMHGLVDPPKPGKRERRDYVGDISSPPAGKILSRDS